MGVEGDEVGHGRIDLVGGNDARSVCIVDLKGNRLAHSEAVSGTQLGLYALGYESLTGSLPQRTEIWELDDLTEHAAPVDETVVVGLRSLVRDVARRIRSGDFAPNAEPARCASCAARGLCGSRADVERTA